MRTVTMRKKEDGEEGSSVAEEVVTERPSVTTGFEDLCMPRQDCTDSASSSEGTYGRKRRPSPRPVIVLISADDPNVRMRRAADSAPSKD